MLSLTAAAVLANYKAQPAHWCLESKDGSAIITHRFVVGFTSENFRRTNGFANGRSRVWHVSVDWRHSNSGNGSTEASDHFSGPRCDAPLEWSADFPRRQMDRV